MGRIGKRRTHLKEIRTNFPLCIWKKFQSTISKNVQCCFCNTKFIIGPIPTEEEAKKVAEQKRSLSKIFARLVTGDTFGRDIPNIISRLRRSDYCKDCIDDLNKIMELYTSIDRIQVKIFDLIRENYNKIKDGGDDDLSFGKIHNIDGKLVKLSPNQKLRLDIIQYTELVEDDPNTESVSTVPVMKKVRGTQTFGLCLCNDSNKKKRKNEKRSYNKRIPSKARTRNPVQLVETTLREEKLETEDDPQFKIEEIGETDNFLNYSTDFVKVELDETEQLENYISELNEQNYEEIFPESGYFRCSLCNYECASFDDYKKHEKVYHSLQPTNEPLLLQEPLAVDEIFIDGKCDKTIRNNGEKQPSKIKSCASRTAATTGRNLPGNSRIASQGQQRLCGKRSAAYSDLGKHGSSNPRGGKRPRVLNSSPSKARLIVPAKANTSRIENQSLKQKDDEKQLTGDKSAAKKYIILESGACLCLLCDYECTNIRCYKRHEANCHPNFSCQYCGKGFAVEKTLIYHLRSHTGEKSFNCSFRKNTFYHKLHLNSHVRAVHNSQATTIFPDSNEILPPATAAENVKKTDELPSEELDCEKKIADNSAKSRSNQTDEIFDQPENEHQKGMSEIQATGSTTITTWICDLCGKNFATGSRLFYHKRHMHKNPRRGFCEQCGKMKANLQRHVFQFHSTDYTCDLCNAKFTEFIEYNYHRTTHPELELNPVKCEEKDCGKIMANNKSLQRHIKEFHKRQFRIICELCGFGTGQNARLAEHMYSKHGQASAYFACDLCDAKFATKKRLTLHIKRHNDELPRSYKCQSCPKSFTMISRLRNHEEAVHGGELKYICDHCGKGFPIKNYLYIHLRSHETPEQKEARRLKAKQNAEARKLAKLQGKQVLVPKGRPYPKNIDSIQIV